MSYSQRPTLHVHAVSNTLIVFPAPYSNGSLIGEVWRTLPKTNSFDVGGALFPGHGGWSQLFLFMLELDGVSNILFYLYLHIVIKFGGLSCFHLLVYQLF